MNKTMSRDIPVELIDADPDQPRKHFDPEALQEMADSLNANGQIVSITVRPVGERFVIVQGERRWRGAQLAGLPTLRAEVSDVDADTAYLLALIENIQRADLTPIEEAEALQRLLANGFTQTALAKRIGKSQSYIATKLRMLTLSASIQTMLAQGVLSEGHAKQILRLPSDMREAVAQQSIDFAYPVSVLHAVVNVCLICPEWVDGRRGVGRERIDSMSLETAHAVVLNARQIQNYLVLYRIEQGELLRQTFAEMERLLGHRPTASDFRQWCKDITPEEIKEIFREEAMSRRMQPALPQVSIERSMRFGDGVNGEVAA